MQLDKDILIPGNKVYSPEACVFVDSQTNTLLTGCTNPRGNYPMGVHFSKGHGKFAAQVHVGTDIPKRLGYFTNAAEAHAAWQMAKADQLDKAAEKQVDCRVAAALSRRADILRLNYIEGVETLFL